MQAPASWQLSIRSKQPTVGKPGWTVLCFAFLFAVDMCGRVRERSLSSALWGMACFLNYYFSFILHTNYSFPSLLSFHFLPPPPIYSLHPFLLYSERGSSPMGVNKTLYIKLRAKLPLHQGWERHSAWGIGSNKPALMHQGPVLIPLLAVPQSDQATQLSSTRRRPVLVPCRCPSKG